MLPNFIILLAIVVGVTSGEDDCEPVNIACKASERDLPESFPKTVEELDHACSEVTDFMNCAIDVEEKCPTYAEAIEEARGMLAIVNDICEEHGVLRPGFANNVECLGEFFEPSDAPRGCQSDEKRINTYMEALEESGEIDSDKELVTRMCLMELDTAACTFLKIEDDCGNDAMEAVLEVMVRVAPVTPTRCAELIGKHLRSIIRMRKAMEENEEIANIFTRK